MTATATESATATAPSLLELELTGLCNLDCTHCYASSGNHGTHGTMTADDWEDVITQAAAIGIKTIQFIGGCFRTRRVP
jgi:MoaA/NifB/PqqE/SkfB family radical SAM enzyme